VTAAGDAGDVVRLVAIHPVEDYGRWKQVLDETADDAAARGMLRRILYRSVDDPQEYLIAVDFRSRAAAEAVMLQGEQVQQWLDRAGVTIYPATFLGTEIECVEFDSG
jgi:hypothetical protein